MNNKSYKQTSHKQGKLGKAKIKKIKSSYWKKDAWGPLHGQAIAEYD
jgi:hypothetical protein